MFEQYGCNDNVREISELWRAAPKSSNGSTIIATVAMACPVCGVKLRVLQGRAYLIGLLAALVPFALVVLSVFLAPVTRRSTDCYFRTGICAGVVFGAVRLHQRSVPRLLTVRLLGVNEKALFPLAPPSVLDPEATAKNALDLEPTAMPGRRGNANPVGGESGEFQRMLEMLEDEGGGINATIRAVACAQCAGWVAAGAAR